VIENTSINRFASMPTTDATTTVTLIEGRGHAFEESGTTVLVRGARKRRDRNGGGLYDDAVDDDDDDDDELRWKNAKGKTSDGSVINAKGWAHWRQEMRDIVVPGRAEVSMLEVTVVNAEGIETARGAVSLATVAGAEERGAGRRLDVGDGVRGKWVEVKDLQYGETVGTLCVRVVVTKGATGVASPRTPGKSGELQSAFRESGDANSERTKDDDDDEEDSLDASMIVETDETGSVKSSGGGLGRTVGAPLNVASRWLAERFKRDEANNAAKEEEKARKRAEREKMIEEKKVQKERERIEREELKAAKKERQEQLKKLKREEKDEWEREREEERARAESNGNSTSHSPLHHLHHLHVPNVEEIKHTLSEGAHHLSDAAHHVTDAIRENGGKILHDVGEHAHHVSDAIKDTSNKVGKALAKRRWIRDIASRVSPNSILLLAIAFFLAGLPENRVRTVNAASRRRRREREHHGARSDQDAARRRAGDASTTEIIYNSTDDYADDDEDEVPYIGRGPTPRGVYEIVEGDTLCSIAGCFNLALVEIIDKNGDVITNPDELSPGDRIRIY
jgi:hypothetical protein